MRVGNDEDESGDFRSEPGMTGARGGDEMAGRAKNDEEMAGNDGDGRSEP